MITVSIGQAYYTEEQAEVLAELAGYQDARDYMEDKGYYRCIGCGDYMLEPSGYSERYRGVLCDYCAAHQEAA